MEVSIWRLDHSSIPKLGPYTSKSSNIYFEMAFIFDGNAKEDDDYRADDDDNDEVDVKGDPLHYNILINASILKKFIESNFICRHFIRRKGGRKISPLIVDIKTIGISSSLTCQCCKIGEKHVSKIDHAHQKRVRELEKKTHNDLNCLLLYLFTSSLFVF